MTKTNFTIILTSFIFLACQGNKSQQVNPSYVPQDPALSGSMQGLKNNLSHLLPIVINQKEFNSAQNQTIILQEIQNLYQISKSVQHTQSIQQTDPSLRFISVAFSEELKRALDSFESGQKEFARYTIMNTTAYCIECHTRTSSGPAFSTPQLERSLTDLRKIERAEYHLATRQFDQALLEFESSIAENLQEKGNLFDLDKAVRYALTISIRFHRDADRARKIVQLIRSSDKAPYFLKQSSMAWDGAIQKWQKQKPVKFNFKTQQGLKDALVFVQNLVDEGKKSQFGISDRGGDVYFLRALSDLHLILAEELKKDQLGQALYLTAISYEAIRDLSLWSLHESYYESCIRQVPHSQWSAKCYQNLEEVVYFGYTGSAGIQVPLDAQMKLNELRVLSIPEIQDKRPNRQ